MNKEIYTPRFVSPNIQSLFSICEGIANEINLFFLVIYILKSLVFFWVCSMVPVFLVIKRNKVWVILFGFLALRFITETN